MTPKSGVGTSTDCDPEFLGEARLILILLPGSFNQGRLHAAHPLIELTVNKSAQLRIVDELRPTLSQGPHTLFAYVVNKHRVRDGLSRVVEY